MVSVRIEMSDKPAPQRGRGAVNNPPNRFIRITLEPDPDWDPAEDLPRKTEFYCDRSQSIVSFNKSPDIPYEASINPYRGCEHGCAYCYARPTHEYLGFCAGLDFETKIVLKEKAAGVAAARAFFTGVGSRRHKS